MSEVRPAGFSGRPVEPAFRPVDPPVPVLVDLGTLFPRQPHRIGGYHPGGLQMAGVVDGRLTCWGICEQNFWWGLVTYEIAYGTQRKAVTHWIPAWLLKRKT